ncbi:hypothetical protein [Corynebacterium sp. 13CS0277]|uniref:hypothetical protein n=1 Tax=Corynebacterium sp. 13CS0277 TaxID=2071994 RepID=UPI001E3902E9|nr:hypothetical protein [Corynebacterium sp. 13CS0277]
MRVHDVGEWRQGAGDSHRWRVLRGVLDTTGAWPDDAVPLSRILAESRVSS